MAALSGSLGTDGAHFASANEGGVDAEQKISPLRVVQSVTVLPFSGSFDRNRISITYPSSRPDAIRGDFQEE